MGDAGLLERRRSILAAAEARGRQAARTEPRAIRAHYDPQVGRVVVDLTNGCTFAFPPKLVQGLEGATDADIGAIEVLGDGYGLHWEGPDVDISIPGLMMGLFGGRSYMARRAGQTRSAAKSQAARANGAKGGRPRKAG
ncbi:MAG: hypothetical protein CFE28_04800 [Alphaproteobacteria bacterium PA2]|nr:MAG: hypothetical protein CFE28_04800 [Alphaproteobacteria bacterium PA2]